MSEPVLLQDHSDPLLSQLTLNRPDRRNALSLELIDALWQAVLEASADKGRRAIVISGAGPAFCAGLDFREAQDPAVADRSADALAALYRAICGSPLVTIAAIHGGAFGGGAGIVAACDFAVAADNLQLGYPEVHRGLVAALVTCLLRRQLAGRALRETLLLGRALSAGEAMAMGLVNRVVGVDRLAAEAESMARATFAGAPGAIARTKSLLDQLDGLDADLTVALEVHRQVRHSDEAAEGIAAFFEKRPPRWG